MTRSLPRFSMKYLASPSTQADSVAGGDTMSTSHSDDSKAVSMESAREGEAERSLVSKKIRSARRQREAARDAEAEIEA